MPPSALQNMYECFSFTTAYLGLSKLDLALFLWQPLHMHTPGQEHISIPASTDQEGLGSSSANRPQEGLVAGAGVFTRPSAPTPSSAELVLAPAAAPGPAQPWELGESREKLLASSSLVPRPPWHGKAHQEVAEFDLSQRE